MPLRSRRPLVGVEDYLGLLLLFLACQTVKLVQTVIIGFVISCDWRNAVSNDLIVECVHQQRPFPLFAVVLKDRHIWHNDLKGCFCVPATFYKILILNTLFSRCTILIFPCFWANAGCFTAFMCQIVRKHPAGVIEDISGRRWYPKDGCNLCSFWSSWVSRIRSCSYRFSLPCRAFHL